ncbi:MAG: DNA mismatch repair endonuclease MutL [Deltaproteobacteria bacterium]|nr:DNA mismatch repair endonuclease MutL [Deltaproteobacteria bacterium]
MGPKVRLLDDTLVDQIAAGEVIERPANLVKELIENAIDAGDGAITVSVEDGGRGQVRVQDDGVGMSRDDATLSIERHATSKIRSFEDLAQVGTLGFRGEALPSIGSVSKMTITTRPKRDLEGTRVVVEGGRLKAVETTGCPAGTSVEVSDLFYNVPARKKFLRARQTETSRILEVCQRVALSQPALRLRVTSDGRVARLYLPSKSLAERAYQVFGDIALDEIHAERSGVLLDAVLAPPELARPGARHLFLLVNGRPIADRALARSIAFAYGGRLPPGHYPRGVVSLRVPPEDVDVNAHPQKTEVRFLRAAQLLDLVTRMIAPHLPDSGRGDAYWSARMGELGPMRSMEPERPGAPPPAELGVAQSESPYEARMPNGLRYVAQLRQSLLLCEGEDELIVLDRQRADTTRILDALRDEMDRGALARQNLLFPDRLQMSNPRAELLDAHEALLKQLGFECSQLGEGSYVVRAVPARLGHLRGATLLDASLDALGGSGSDARARALAALARAGATPNGEMLSDEEARRIVGAIWPSRKEHQSCIVGRVALPSGPVEGVDA